MPEDEAATWAVAVMELGALVCTATNPRCVDCPISESCAWNLAGRPAYDGPPRRGQAWAGTDRQVRGRLMAVLRETEGTVPRARLDAVWSDAVQRDRALASLLADGLVVETDRPLLLAAHLTPRPQPAEASQTATPEPPRRRRNAPGPLACRVCDPGNDEASQKVSRLRRLGGGSGGGQSFFGTSTGPSLSSGPPTGSSGGASGSSPLTLPLKVNWAAAPSPSTPTSTIWPGPTSP